MISLKETPINAWKFVRVLEFMVLQSRQEIWDISQNWSPSDVLKQTSLQIRR